MAQPNTTEVVELNRLSPDSLRALKAKLPKIGCPSTELEAGYLLGINKVLDVLREGWTIGDVA